MAITTIYIGVLDSFLESVLSDLYPQDGTVVGYLPLTNEQFHSFLSIRQETKPNEQITPYEGVSDFNTIVHPGDIINWQIQEIATQQVDEYPLLAGLSIDMVSIYDKANSPYVMHSQPTPEIGTANTVWSCQIKPDFLSNRFYPAGLTYFLQFSFAYNKNYYYFQFDPLITPKPKPKVE